MLHISSYTVLFHREYYLTSVRWVTNQRICAVWSVRAQNLSLISFCDAGPWHCQTVNLSNSISFIDCSTSQEFQTVWSDGRVGALEFICKLFVGTGPHDWNGCRGLAQLGDASPLPFERQHVRLSGTSEDRQRRLLQQHCYGGFG